MVLLYLLVIVVANLSVAHFGGCQTRLTALILQERLIMPFG